MPVVTRDAHAAIAGLARPTDGLAHGRMRAARRLWKRVIAHGVRYEFRQVHQSRLSGRGLAHPDRGPHEGSVGTQPLAGEPAVPNRHAVETLIRAVDFMQQGAEGCGFGFRRGDIEGADRCLVLGEQRRMFLRQTG